MKLPCAAAAAALFLSGCGYIGEPMYPLLNIPARVTDLAAVQRGAAIIYQFTLPELTTEGKLAKVGKVEIRVGDSTASTRLEAKPDANGHVLSELPAAAWVGKDLVLAVKVYGANGRDAGWSNLATVTVIQPLATPLEVKAEPVPEGVRVSWQGPAGQYRVFRRTDAGKELALLATAEATQWLDATTEYGKQYSYVIQAVKKAGASEAQSDLSEAQAVTPVDIFPPAVPTGLNAIAAADNIELVWDRNTEGDLAGYRLYRASPGGPLEKLADIPETPSYSDRKVESGKQYRYAVSALDRLGNESKLSEPAAVTAP